MKSKSPAEAMRKSKERFNKRKQAKERKIEKRRKQPQCQKKLF